MGLILGTGHGLGYGNRRQGWSPARLSPWQWLDVAGLAHIWQDTAGSTPVTAAGQSIARIDDRSGNGRHVVQATAGNRGAYTSGGGVTLDGSTDGYATAGTHSLTGGAMWLAAVVELTAAGSFPAAWCYGTNAMGDVNLRAPGTSRRPSFIWASANSGAGETGAAASGTTSAMLTGVKHVVVGALSAQSAGFRQFRIWQQGTLRDTNTVAAAGMNVNNTVHVGIRGAGTPWPGVICELVAIDAEITDSHRDLMTTYLADKWGISL